MRAKLAVIVCHEEKAKGASSVQPLGQYEYDYVYELATYIEAFAKSSDDITFEVGVFLRNGVGISGAYRNALSWIEKSPLDVCALIEPHFNAAPNHLKGQAHGTETLLCSTRDLPWVNEGLLAAFVHHAVLDTLGTRDRGLKQRPEGQGEAGWFNLNQTIHYPSILPELFFGDHPGDAKSAYENKLALAENMTLAVQKFFDTVMADRYS